MSLSLVLPADQCSVITIAEPGVDSPAWARRLRWPGAGDDHVALPAGGGDPRVWATRLDSAVLRAERPALLLAEGIGCVAASWWARLSPSHYVSRVAGAILFDPLEDSDERRRRFAAPATALPFPTVVVGTEGAAPLPPAFADWGGRFVDGARPRRTGPVSWSNARRLMLRLTRRVVERDIEQAYALRGERR